jgi:hypothetical protein
VFRSRNHLPGPPAAFLFGSLGLPARRRASSKENGLNNRICSGEARTASQKSQNLAGQNWYSTRTPASDALELFPTGSLLFKRAGQGQPAAASSSPSSQRRGGGGLDAHPTTIQYLPHEGTRKGKRPVLAALHCGRSFSRRRTSRPSVQQGRSSFWRDDRSACWENRRRAWVVGARLLPVLEPDGAGVGSWELGAGAGSVRRRQRSIL